ncbi:hypothetical protein AB0I84_43250 [Streptomyces spectabilis]|uniref:hypothetical protein n=1 Tax=Streptomyces spectabilis TaxID=68270 RepID=UPI0033D5DCD4
MSGQGFWQEWLDSLDVPRKAAAQSLYDQFSALGVANPVGLVMSEVVEGYPQLARFVLLRSLWQGTVDGWAAPTALDQLPAAQRLMAAGADREDLVRLVQAVAYESVFTALEELDAGAEGNVPGAGVGWVVMERGEDGLPTGRALEGLHEDLLTADPSGRDGTGLWQ